MYRIPILEVESTVVLFDPEEKRMIRELNERLDCGENDVVRDAVREYYKKKFVYGLNVAVPYRDHFCISGEDGDRIYELKKRLNKSESEVVSAALKLYEDALNAVDESLKHPTRMSFEVICDEETL